MPPQLSLANLSRKLTSLFTQKRSKSSSSKKTKSAIKIQSTFRGRNTRKKLTAIAEAFEKKIVAEAERLFNNANKSKAKRAIIDMGRDVDQERIEIMLWHLWADLTVKQRNTWLTKARKKLSK
jgi:hypothetical protein